MILKIVILFFHLPWVLCTNRSHSYTAPATKQRDMDQQYVNLTSEEINEVQHHFVKVVSNKMCDEDEDCFLNNGEEECGCNPKLIGINSTCWDNPKLIERNSTCWDSLCPMNSICKLDESRPYTIICTCNVGYFPEDEICKGCDCGENGKCSYENGNPKCTCKEGYDVNDENDGKCDSCDCGKNGKCSYEYGEPKCTCEEEYGKCDRCDCGENGKCLYENGKPKCTCEEGYEVNEENDGKCDSCDCGENGKCSYKSGKPKCICKEGFEVNDKNDGNCDITVCKDNPCENGGNCDADPEGKEDYNCFCQTPYEGRNCEIVKACKGRTCGYRRTCDVDPENEYDYKCICEYPFAGEDCDIEILDPIFIQELEDVNVYEGESVNFTVKFAGYPAPEVKWRKEILRYDDWKIDGDRIKIVTETEGLSALVIENVTKDDEGEYTCILSNDFGNEAFSSNNLTVKESLCKGVTCQNRGTCEFDKERNDYNCSCEVPYTGKDCEMECFCPENSICILKMNGIKKEFQCLCNDGFHLKDGLCKEICNPNPCIYGKCSQFGANSYSCRCNPGYIGVHCDEVDITWKEAYKSYVLRTIIIGVVLGAALLISIIVFGIKLRRLKRNGSFDLELNLREPNISEMPKNGPPFDS